MAAAMSLPPWPPSLRRCPFPSPIRGSPSSSATISSRPCGRSEPPHPPPNPLLPPVGRAEPAAPDHYTLVFNIRAQEDKAIESATAERVLRRTVRLSVAFSLQEHGTGKVVYRGKTFSQASYDQVGQSFADLQAKTEAAERAAHEVSVDIHTRLAAHFAS